MSLPADLQHTRAPMIRWRLCYALGATLLGAVGPLGGSALAVTLRARDAATFPGNAVSVTLDLNNDVAVRAVQVTVTAAPAVLQLVGVRTTTRSQQLTADAHQAQDGSTTAVLISLGSATLSPGTGSVLVLDYAVGADWGGGAIEIRLSEAQAANTAGATIPLTLGNSHVTLLTCVADCSHNGSVTVDELLQAVNIALGVAAVQTCQVADADADGFVTVDELLVGVTNAVSGCSVERYTSRCGGPARVQCPPGWFCELPVGACGFGASSGSCQRAPDECPQQLVPVCGCNATTYKNDCERKVAGVAKSKDGACSGH